METKALNQVVTHKSLDGTFGTVEHEAAFFGVEDAHDHFHEVAKKLTNYDVIWKQQSGELARARTTTCGIQCSFCDALEQFSR